jgi:long-subunit acyl-CoA synthetase (AMP-forming)
LISDTSPAYICCLLTGILLQSVVYSINGSLNIDAIKHILSITNPSIILIGEQYLDKVVPILSEEQMKRLTILHKNEEQFEQIKTNNDLISLTKAFELGENSSIDLTRRINLSLFTNVSNSFHIR